MLHLPCPQLFSTTNGKNSTNGGSTNSTTHLSSCLAKEEVVEIARNNLFKKTIIQVTPVEFSCLKKSIICIMSAFANYTSVYMKCNVQQPDLRPDREQQYSTPQTSKKLCYSNPIHRNQWPTITHTDRKNLNESTTCSRKYWYPTLVFRKEKRGCLDKKQS